MRIFSEYQGDFKKVCGANVLIYFPHGLGDWVMFSYILPLLNSSNRYFMTRFGDDYTSVMEGSPACRPVYTGQNNVHCSDGADFGNIHFGINYDIIDGEEQTLDLPISVYNLCVQEKIDTLLWVVFPEPGGWNQYPFHNKSRFQIPLLVQVDQLNELNLNAPLQSSICFNVAPWLQGYVESRLASCLGLSGRRLCLISRTGYTSVGKNWGHLWREEQFGGVAPEGEECRDFMRLMLRKDPDWAFLSMESILFYGDATLRSEELHCATFADIFGVTSEGPIPFALILKAVMNVADLSIGVPTGPYELSLAKPDLPTVGIWLEHCPSWYDEPREGSVNVVGKNVREHHLHDRPGSFERVADLDYHVRWCDTHRITGEQAFAAVEDLLYS